MVGVGDVGVGGVGVSVGAGAGVGVRVSGCALWVSLSVLFSVWNLGLGSYSGLDIDIFQCFARWAWSDIDPFVCCSMKQSVRNTLVVLGLMNTGRTLVTKFYNSHGYIGEIEEHHRAFGVLQYATECSGLKLRIDHFFLRTQMFRTIPSLGTVLIGRLRGMKMRSSWPAMHGIMVSIGARRVHARCSALCRCGTCYDFDGFQSAVEAVRVFLREAHEKSLKEMEELKRFQGSTFDTISRRTTVQSRLCGCIYVKLMRKVSKK